MLGGLPLTPDMQTTNDTCAWWTTIDIHGVQTRNDTCAWWTTIDTHGVQITNDTCMYTNIVYNYVLQIFDGKKYMFIPVLIWILHYTVYIQINIPR